MKTFLKITLLFLVWRFFLFFVGAIADHFISYAPSFPYADGILDAYSLPRWLYSWGNFDGVHYITIMTKGYHGADLIQAFFPVYPYLVKVVNYIFDNYLLTSLIVSNLSFLALLFLWYIFIKENYTQKLAFWATLVLLFFPTSLFLVASYTESIFLIFVIASFYFVQKKRYFLTALFIALASATRITGILLLPAIWFEIIWPDFVLSLSWEENKRRIKAKVKNVFKLKKPLFITSLGGLGLALYMLYLYKDFADPLYFFHVQAEFGGGVRQEKLILYPQVVWRYLKILLTSRPINFKYYSYLQDFFVSTVGLLVLFYSAVRTRLSYFIFAILAFFLPTLTGTFSSMPRYILVSFPLFIILAVWSEKSLFFRVIWFTLSGILLVLNTVLFIQGYWVA